MQTLSPYYLFLKAVSLLYFHLTGPRMSFVSLSLPVTLFSSVVIAFLEMKHVKETTVSQIFSLIDYSQVQYIIGSLFLRSVYMLFKEIIQ